jgi:hypothetical protein
MRFKLTVFLLSLLVVSMFSGASFAQVPLLSETYQAVTEKEVRQLIDDYLTRFVAMQLDPLMALFSKDAIENRVLPYEDIKAAFRKVIATSESVSCEFEIYSIKTYKQSASVTGHYQAVQTFVDNTSGKIFEGDIQWILVREDGLLKIKKVNYGKYRRGVGPPMQP